MKLGIMWACWVRETRIDRGLLESRASRFQTTRLLAFTFVDMVE